MNYIGSKRSLLPVLQQAFRDLSLPTGAHAVDAFGGTAIVSCLLRAEGYRVTLNEWQAYGRQLGHVWLQCDSLPDFAGLLGAEPSLSARQKTVIKTRDWRGDWGQVEGVPAALVLGHLQNLAPVSGAFSESFGAHGAGGRMYFSRENAQKIEAIRACIALWHAAGWLQETEHAWLLAVLIEAADRVANTASVYGAHLKHVKATARRPLELVALLPDGPGTTPVAEHKVLGCDATSLKDTMLGGPPALMYVDPPYNARQYASNYHVLETIVLWDLATFEPRGATGLRPARENRSDFCLRPRVAKALAALLDGVQAQNIVLSYSSEGLLDAEQLQQLVAQRYADVAFTRIPYARFQSDQPHARRRIKSRQTEEWLVTGRSYRAL